MPKARSRSYSPYTIEISLPVRISKLIDWESRARSKIEIKQQQSSTKIIIMASDMPSLKSSINSVLRDLAVSESINRVSD